MILGVSCHHPVPRLEQKDSSVHCVCASRTPINGTAGSREKEEEEDAPNVRLENKVLRLLFRPFNLSDMELKREEKTGGRRLSGLLFQDGLVGDREGAAAAHHLTGRKMRL